MGSGCEELIRIPIGLLFQTDQTLAGPKRTRRKASPDDAREMSGKCIMGERANLARKPASQEEYGYGAI